MAVYREPPVCPHCGEYIKGIYDSQEYLPVMMRRIGDNFMGWDYEGHICNPIKLIKHKFFNRENKDGK